MIVFNQTTQSSLVSNCTLAVKHESQLRGFQFVKELSPEDGIFFKWQDSSIRGIHMRNVAFPLLIIWLGKENEVLWFYIANPSPTAVYSSVTPAWACLECHPSKITAIDLGDKLVLANR